MCHNLLRDFLNQIKQALNGNLYYVALWGCLTIPDICGAIDSSNGRATPQKYATWYNKWVASHCPYLNGQNCYLFRCSMLHQGSASNLRGGYSRILFIEPGATTSILHCNVMDNALNIDVRIFCNAMIAGALRWLNSVGGTPRFTRNYGRFVRRYPSGLAPYIVGIPVIA